MHGPHICGLTGDLRALRPRVRDIIVDPTHNDPTDNMFHAGSRRTVERELLSNVGVHPQHTTPAHSWWQLHVPTAFTPHPFQIQ